LPEKHGGLLEQPLNRSFADPVPAQIEEARLTTSLHQLPRRRSPRLELLRVQPSHVNLRQRLKRTVRKTLLLGSRHRSTTS
jgi:hypothetical protein